MEGDKTAELQCKSNLSLTNWMAEAMSSSFVFPPKTINRLQQTRTHKETCTQSLKTPRPCKQGSKYTICLQIFVAQKFQENIILFILVQRISRLYAHVHVPKAFVGKNNEQEVNYDI